MDDFLDETREPPPTPWADALDRALMAEDPEACARQVARLHSIASQVKRAIGDAEEHLIACMDGKRQLVASDLRVEVDKRADRKAWKWDELYSAVLPKIRTQPRLVHDSGEFEDDTARAMRYFRSCFSVSAGKVTGLRDLLIDPDEFCEVTPGHLAVRVVQLEDGSPW